ncbi:VCBS repeat-containing protein [Paenarthrobacter aurescens]|uniref:VCBS repeat-containing protein n=1 Tax=Paenarthrobacter aurescens TaxID=43663 RepID=UPI0021BF980F|nr:VCBS repeat-containing protein [Paenarthrobacter aurescens]MCT9869727.1 VCBS repeat-containing protein [Paenarthrobacter aurescens]
MGVLRRSIALSTGLVVFATGLFFVQAPATAVPLPGPDNPNVQFVEGTPHSEHTFETPPVDNAPKGQADVDSLLRDGALAAGPGGDIRVRLVTAKLADNTNPVSMAGAEQAVAATSSYWKAMTANKLSMSVASKVAGHQSKAKSTDSYSTIMSTITSELKWSASPYTALVIFVPTATLSGNALGAGYSSGSYSGRVLMPQISNFSNNVMSHEFGHVIGLMHADALQCRSGASDVGVDSNGRFTDSSCYIREYGDTTDIMGAAQYTSPVVSSTLWDFAGLGRGDEIRDVGVASGVKSYTLKPWGGTEAQRAIKFTDPISREVYYLELRQPAGYDNYLSASTQSGNRGVKIVQRGGATIASSLILMPSTVPFSEPYYAKNHAWQAGSTFTTYTGTKVTINSVSSTSATVTINADPKLKTRMRFSAGDFDGDKLADVISREADGSLLLFAGLPGNRLEDSVRIGSGWDIFNAVLGTSDFTGDGFADIVARSSDGALWLYPGNGKGGFLPRSQVGIGWQGFTQLVAPGDFNGDGRADVIASDPDGRLWLYPGNGSGGFLARAMIGQGWDSFNSLAPAGSFGGGPVGLLARANDGTLFVYPGDGEGGFLPRAAVGSGWNGAGDIVGGQDLTGDQRADVLAGASMILYPGDGAGFADRLAIGTGWNQFSQVWEAGDFDGDAVADILARGTNGVLWLYPGNGSGGFLPRVQLGTGWNVFTAVLSAGDFDGDKHPDLVARSSDGTLWLYPTDGKGQFLARKQIGTGWQGFTELLAPGDFSGDGRADILARAADGSMWLYPGNGAGGFQPWRQIGTGWNIFNAVMQGSDFNGDGREDVLARGTDGALWLYPGNGSGGFLARQYLGSGWNMFTTFAAIGNAFTGTGDPSLVGVAGDGTLLTYSGTGRGAFKPVALNPR